ncbi:TIR domain-containing protein [Campylobacter coli]|uniref:TIR domain-containing protein n=1 Tax=Campylobacter coli TaxID=195 RepID=UPI000B0E3915|nr:TIR domain-containing protein [Campylobacter coli]HED6588244.1 TIR domain-containing protein [Campylobacter coli]HED6595470.1 TIR domain-containing protein [Campylobacter coli]HED6603895.1 TIR domain-containing protein [Campylobacter coli]
MKTYNLFISHSWRYEDKYEKLVKLLNEKPYFDYKNHSVPSTRPIVTATGTDEELYAAIKNKIKGTNVVIILAGVYATYSNWINNEIYIAKNEFTLPKPILAIEYWGSERTSKIVKDKADLIVKWNTDSIVNAIKELSKKI